MGIKKRKSENWKRVFWGGRVRREFQSQVLQIAASVGRSEHSHCGNMVTSRETVTYRFLDGAVRYSSGYFDASSGVFVSGDLCLQYVLYELGFDPRQVLDDGSAIHSLEELERQIALQRKAEPKNAR